MNGFMKNGAFSLITLAAVILSLTYFMNNAALFERFMPRAVCMFRNERLIQMHLISDFLIFVSYSGIGVILFIVYRKLRNVGIPFMDFMWKFGGFIFFCGLTHLMDVIALFVTYYWLDGLVKLLTMWFSFLTFISLLQNFRDILKVRTPQEYEKLAHRYQELLEELFIKKSA